MIGAIKKKTHRLSNLEEIKHLIKMSTSWRLAKMDDLSREDCISSTLWIDVDELETPTIRMTNSTVKIVRDISNEKYHAMLIKV